MNKIFSICFLLCIILSSCVDFLELYPVTTLNENNFYNTENELILLANGCYVPLRNNTRNIWALTEMRSDNASYQSPSDAGQWARVAFDEFLYESNNYHLNNFWSISYQGIYRCNQLLFNIDREEIKWSKESYKQRCKGEAFFLRALYYFDLVRQFGGVPIVTQAVSARDAVNIKRSSVEQTYDLIVSDLLNSIDCFVSSVGVDENGRANEMAALSLLGKVYLTIHAYSDAELVLHKVISSGKYILRENYADLFNPADKDYEETIFAVQYSDATSDLSNSFIFNFVPWTSKGEITNRPNISLGNGAGFNQPTVDLINAFESGDLRKDVSINFWNGIDWDGEVRDIPFCAKYKSPSSAPDHRCNDNFPIIRFSDVLLMYAEVLNEQGKTAEAIPHVQRVRNRAGLLDPLNGYDKASLAKLISKERQTELCFENHRWYDLLRTGMAIEVMTSHGQRELALKPYLSTGAYKIEPYKLLSPIPVEEILRNKIEQNPGY